MKHQKPLIRRTFLQERFMILMELQQKGMASFDELTELDELINRDPKLRDIILEEMKETGGPIDTPNYTGVAVEKVKQQTLLQKLWSYISEVFHFIRPVSCAFPC